MSRRSTKPTASKQDPPKKKKPATAVVTSSDESDPSDDSDEEYIFKAIHHHQHLQEAEQWNTVVNTKKIKREERYERKKEREVEQQQAVAAEQERYKAQAASNPYANLLPTAPTATKTTPQYNAFGRKKLPPKVHKYVHSPEDEEEIVLTNFEKVQQKKANRSSKPSTQSKPVIQIHSEQDLVNTIANILDRSPEPYLPVATAAAELVKLTKTSWNDTYKRSYGPLATFLSSHPSTFAVVDNDKLFLKPRLEAFLQTTIGRPKKKKVKKTDADTTDGQRKKKQANGQNGQGTDEDDENDNEDNESSSSNCCSRCCSTLFFLILVLVLIAIVSLVVLSIKRITVDEAITHIHHITQPYTQRLHTVIKPHLEKISPQIVAVWEQVKQKYATFQQQK